MIKHPTTPEFIWQPDLLLLTVYRVPENFLACHFDPLEICHSLDPKFVSGRFVRNEYAVLVFLKRADREHVVDRLLQAPVKRVASANPREHYEHLSGLENRFHAHCQSLFRHVGEVSQSPPVLQLDSRVVGKPVNPRC